MCGRRRMDKGSGAQCARPAEPSGRLAREVCPAGVIWPNLFFVGFAQGFDRGEAGGHGWTRTKAVRAPLAREAAC